MLVHIGFINYPKLNSGFQLGARKEARCHCGSRKGGAPLLLGAGEEACRRCWGQGGGAPPPSLGAEEEARCRSDRDNSTTRTKREELLAPSHVKWVHRRRARLARNGLTRRGGGAQLLFASLVGEVQFWVRNPLTLGNPKH
jgi:hypothetical protein